MLENIPPRRYHAESMAVSQIGTILALSLSLSLSQDFPFNCNNL